MKLLQRLKNLFLPEGKISDGFHSFDELYHYRMLYNAAFFNSLEGKYEVHKSYRHADGELIYLTTYFMVDNFEYLANLFDGLVDRDDFYFVQIIQRKKDGVELPSYTSGARTIRSFYFFTKEEFLRQESYIKDLCNSNNARAYFWINPRNTLDIACESIKQFADLIKNGNTRQGIAVYDRATGASRSSNYKKLWIVDIDSKDDEYRNRIISLINECRGAEGDRIKHIIPTVNGYHLISNGFDRQQFSQKLALYQLDQIDIHDNNPTLLYYKTLCQNLS